MSMEVRIFKKLERFDLDVAFTVSEGTVGLMGHSGSGKSMTLKCIAGIETPDAGRIVIDGRTVFDRDRGIDLPPQMRNVGYLFQNYALFDHMTARGNVRAGMKAHGFSRREMEETEKRLFEALRLQGMEDRYPRQLSGGERQRLALARMLACRPDALLLDEPFSALDADLRASLRRECREILEEYQKPAVLVTHDEADVKGFCREVYRMEEGKLK